MSEESSNLYCFQKRRVCWALEMTPWIAVALTTGLAMLVGMLLETSSAMQWLLGLSIAGACSLMLLARYLAPRQFFFDPAVKVLAIKKGNSWHIVAGFKAIRIPEQVQGNPWYFLQNMYYTKGISFRIIISRHEQENKHHPRSLAWFIPEDASSPRVRVNPNEFSWMLMLEKKFSIVTGLKRNIDRFARTRDVVKALLPNTFQHHGFSDASGEDLAAAFA